MTKGYKKGKKFIPTDNKKGSLRGMTKEKIQSKATHTPNSIGNSELIRKKQSQVMAHPKLEETTGYNVKLKKSETIRNPKHVTLKNGKPAIQGVGSDGTKITRFISNDHSKHLSK